MTEQLAFEDEPAVGRRWQIGHAEFSWWDADGTVRRCIVGEY